MEVTRQKRNGVHYTPRPLAEFLAAETIRAFQAGGNQVRGHLRILDPACGDGELLERLIVELEQANPTAQIEVVGFDVDAFAIESAQQRLERYKRFDVQLKQLNFLDEFEPLAPFDIVIANPPYVRTQVIGSARSQILARRFGLHGRVDLYQAFAAAISGCLRPRGVMGLLTSNRFMNVKAGASMRHLIAEKFRVHTVFDLGDTKCFDAAVLPVVLTGWRVDCDKPQDSPATFCRVHSVSESNDEQVQGDLFDAITDSERSFVTTAHGTFHIQRGQLAYSGNGPWRISNLKNESWLRQVVDNQVGVVGDIADVKVGIKTTADSVFIRTNWKNLESPSPEDALLRPLLTHHVANRWSADAPQRTVLYPYLNQRKREPVSLERFPQTASYLGQFRDRLEGRRYLIDANREWFEIWVPHQPSGWAAPKIVWPDISIEPRFFIDTSGAVVNGDCYWLKLKSGIEPEWLYLILAVCNSRFSTQYYDIVFHNKLYSGRRRFMTQYVKEFPIPDLNAPLSRKLVEWVKQQLVQPTRELELRIDQAVARLFGVDSAADRSGC